MLFILPIDSLTVTVIFKYINIIRKETMSDLLEKVEEVIKDSAAQSLGIEKSTLNSETAFADLDIKSVNYVHIVAALQDEFDAMIPFMELRRKATIGEAAEFVVEILES